MNQVIHLLMRMIMALSETPCFFAGFKMRKEMLCPFLCQKGHRNTKEVLRASRQFHLTDMYQ